MAHKTWAQKYETRKEPEIETADKDFADVKKGDKMLIATPRIFDEYIREIPKGHAVDLPRMRKDIAAQFNCDVMCPITSGIFLRIVAEKAHEEYTQGATIKKITPFWRAIGVKSSTAKKLTFGTAFIADMRNSEKIDA